AKNGEPRKLLKGGEVNVKADGTLDVADALLAGRDWVVASIHTAFDRSPTERILATMENPHVHVIGHLTGRKLNRREPMEIDLERVVEKALETGTFLEINSQPDRLDLRDVDARLAGEAGVKIVVSRDAHVVAEAAEQGGEARVAMRFDTTEMGSNRTEICAYGTAVKIRNS